MNYFMFNNVDSREIAGLIVQELPPISKPARRVSIAEIDGKDGDISEFKGYSAYDKNISIGLTKGYNIDQIINWLNGSGRLILSNEPDKYYEAEINNQIDFDRLGRFKTATIKFHVQPFKYKLNEEKQILEITDQTNFNVTNHGLIESKPIITLYGSGIVEVLLNNISIFTINIDDEYVTIDTIKEDAYRNGILKNRLMNGDFENIRLQSGQNIISWTGNLTKIEVDAKSRWI